MKYLLYRGCAIWEVLPLDAARKGYTMNHSYWVMIWRQRYKKSVVYLKESKENTISSKMEAAWESLREGGITPQEFNRIASGLAAKCRIAEVDLRKQRLEHMKESSEASKAVTDEAIRASIEAYMAVMNGTGKVAANT